jgi:hypothetical protein
MDNKWYNVVVPCLKCKEIAHVYNVAFSGDGELRFDVYCRKCEAKMEWKAYACQLAHDANGADFEAHVAKTKPDTAIQPSLKQIAAPVWTSQDFKTLHDDFGIADEDNEAGVQ